MFKLKILNKYNNQSQLILDVVSIIKNNRTSTFDIKTSTGQNYYLNFNQFNIVLV